MNRVVGISFCGGFGNQLFQYTFARAYAEATKATLLTPKWIGQKVFTLSDPILDCPLPRAGFDEIPDGKVNIILSGYFQSQKAINLLSRSKLRSWLNIRDKWRQTFTLKLPVAAHVRRGDYVDLGNIYCLVSESSYVEACLKFGLNPSLITWVRDGLRPQIQILLDEGIPFLEDFMLLVNSDVLLRANSSFSWWAGVLTSGRVFSPLVEDRVGVQNVDFIEGNWPRMVDSRNCNTNITDLYLKD